MRDETPRKTAGVHTMQQCEMAMTVSRSWTNEDPVAVIVVSVDDGLPTWFGNWEQKTRLVVVHERDGSHEER